MGVKQYLLDTNICIYYLAGKHDVEIELILAGMENCAISEISVAELKFGVANSQHVAENTRNLTRFISLFTILPIYPVLDFYAIEKTRLRRLGVIIDEFDLLIGATAVVHNRIMVTDNTKHFKHIDGIVLENWVRR